MRYYKYTLTGDHSEAEAQKALADSKAQGTIVRIDSVRGQTHVYVASQETSAAPPKAKGAAKSETALKRQEIQESDITKFS